MIITLKFVSDGDLHYAEFTDDFYADGDLPPLVEHIFRAAVAFHDMEDFAHVAVEVEDVCEDCDATFTARATSSDITYDDDDNPPDPKEVSAEVAKAALSLVPCVQAALRPHVAHAYS